MFGEYDEPENVRVPSPWDPFLPSPPTESSSLQSRRTGIPKLAPEVEEVRYMHPCNHVPLTRSSVLNREM